MNEGLVWRKSCHSGDEGNCVEVADLSAGRAVRDSKNPTGGHLTFSRDQWAAFTAGVRAGQFD
jgi:hypothetical protein